MLGPAFETFFGALVLVALVLLPVALVLRHSAAALVQKIRETDRRQLEALQTQETEQRRLEQQRRDALEELERDCNIETKANRSLGLKSSNADEVVIEGGRGEDAHT